MSVIVELELDADDFELGRILDMISGARVELETMVPVGRRAVPLFWVYDGDRHTFVDGVREHPSVNQVTKIDVYEDRVLFALDWDVQFDHVFEAITALDGHVLDATGRVDTWYFELRFKSHEELSSLRDRLERAEIGFEVLRVYNPTNPDAGPWFGLTESQREALLLAVEKGYYSIPRNCTTVELAEDLGISDQAVTERLRRAIVALVSNTLLATEES